MRIIAGELRGRRLRSPSGRGTRPMLDRVREALFSTLGRDVEDACVLDLFAGTGALGLEALSRGAASARLVERHRPTAGSLRETISELGLTDRARVVVADALERRSWAPAADAGRRYGLVFLDPPYPLLERADERRGLLEAVGILIAERLTPGGVLVFHAPRGRVRADELGPRVQARVREYGSNALWYLTRPTQEPR